MAVTGTLNIVSFNIKGLKPRNYDYLQSLFDKSDILLIQETWLYEFEHRNISKILPGSSCIGVSGMNEHDLERTGRPYGGTMIIYKLSKALPVSQIQTNSKRICAASVITESFKLLLISIYMPCDDNSNESASEYLDLLNELTGLLNTYENFTIVVGGDFNVDLSRNTVNTNLLDNYLMTESLVSVGNVFDSSDYTYESYNGARSVIDHFLVSLRNVCDISKYDVLYEGTNLSDHNPIRMQINIENINMVETNEIIDVQITSSDWNAATDENMNNYKNYLDEYIEFLDLDNNVVNCNNSKCTIESHREIVNYLEMVIDIMLHSANTTIPKKMEANNNSRYKSIYPGWNHHVKPKREVAIIWHKIWKQAGSPKEGQLFNIRRFTRKQYVCKTK